MLSEKLEQCLEDMRRAGRDGVMSLDAQVRAYDLLEVVIEISECPSSGMGNEGFLPFAEEFCAEYSRLSVAVDEAYNHDALLMEAEERLKPYKDALSEAHRCSEEAAVLHELARETYRIWQGSGFFERRRALRRLRSLAGFRLESHRLGNYVAKTFDLMNEADAVFARSQQAVFAADMSYKIKPGLYHALAGILKQ